MPNDIICLKESEMNKKKIIGVIFGVIVIVYLMGVVLFSQKLLPNTTFSAQSINMLNKDSLVETVTTKFKGQTITVKDDVVTDYAPKLVDLGASINAEKLKADIESNQSPFKWPVQVFSNQDYDLTKYIELDTKVLKDKLEEDNFINADGRTKAESASTYYDEENSTFAIKKEVLGTTLNKKFLAEFEAAVKAGESEFDATAYYKKPAVTSDDLSPKIDSLNERLNRKVSVKFGDESVTIPKKTVATFLYVNDDGEIDVDNTTLYNWLYKKSSDYDSAKTSGGERVVTSYNVDPAYYQIEEGLLSDDSADIVGTTEVETFHQDSSQTSIPSSGTYIEISISQQNMWLYNDDKLIVETPVVTGNVASGWDTPTGTFSVWSKETDKVLDGSTVGYDYEVPVDYWMAIDYTGVGIHDIDWLTSSNAEASRDVYKTEGSHGCINTPNDVMAKVYNNTPLGTPVYVMP